MTRDLAAVMITVDRSPEPNYLVGTLGNLARGGAAKSARLAKFVLVDNDAGADFALSVLRCLSSRERPPQVHVESLPSHAKDRCANMNVAWSLQVGTHYAPWVLFLEDDIDVCADFFDGVGAWLDDHAREDRRVYPLGANYGWVREAMELGRSAVDYPVSDFYGTQAFAIRSEDAADLSRYLIAHCYDRADDGTAYDLLIADWHAQRYPEIGHFLTPAPSFIQHIGRSSVIRPRPETHVFPTWPGRAWSYIEHRRAA